ncbi:hypothetical protein NGRA_2018 [Nosema granulosis]|uniref:Pol polyprotein n=1 Tax=Nosema granulosis TaxID=83296 RepID=A0A9P6GYF5_9MICR|nr:hypothetical protein NGRA_2018 [Nosema granulosis]
MSPNYNQNTDLNGYIFHRNTVGAVERVNQTLWNILKRLTEFGKSSWRKAVDKATYTTNISLNRAIGTYPYIIRWSKSPELEIDKELGLRALRYQRDLIIDRRNNNFKKYKKILKRVQFSLMFIITEETRY